LGIIYSSISGDGDFNGFVSTILRAYVFDVVRSTVPQLDLDELFESKETVAHNVQRQLLQAMDEFGYTIVQALVTDLNPDAVSVPSRNFLSLSFNFIGSFAASKKRHERNQFQQALEGGSCRESRGRKGCPCESSSEFFY
jgi:hypothetical protein